MSRPALSAPLAAAGEAWLEETDVRGEPWRPRPEPALSSRGGGPARHPVEGGALAMLVLLLACAAAALVALIIDRDPPSTPAGGAIQAAAAVAPAPAPPSEASPLPLLGGTMAATSATLFCASLVVDPARCPEGDEPSPLAPAAPP
jgi:hypothetical protein